MRALLSYLPSKINNDYGNGVYASILPKILNELGYIVDYIDWKDTTWKRNQDYDLFIGHGGHNFEYVYNQLNADARTTYAKTIYFSTGFYWQLFNFLELQRLDDLNRRKGASLQPDRLIRVPEDFALSYSDGIITLGNQITKESYSKFPNVYAVGGSITNLRYDGLDTKDYFNSRKHFLFYSGPGNVHKGLDLLLEAFIGTDLHLHICQVIEPQFKQVYFKELTKYDNIHVYGKINLGSMLFVELAKMCNWIISATCCEGCPSSVLECMQYGLIPVIPRNASVDIDSFGINLNVNEIKNIIIGLSNMIVDECRYRAMQSQKKIEMDYSPSAFVNKFKKAIEGIING